MHNIFSRLVGTITGVTLETSSIPAERKKNISSWKDNHGNYLEITRMDLTELSHYHYSWAIAQDWAPTKDSLDAIFYLDTTGFYCLKKNGETVATVSAIKYPKLKIVYVGFFISDQKFRGQGYGKLLWHSVMQELKKEGYTVTLSCLDHLLPLYQKLGFTRTGDDIVWSYIANNEAPASVQKNDAIEIVVVEGAQHELLESIVQYDAQHIHDSPERKTFLLKWMIKQSTITVAAKNLSGEMVGYGVMSRRLTSQGESGFRIGPLVVSDDKAGEMLLNHFKDAAGLDAIFMDTCGSQSAAAHLAAIGKFKKVIVLNRMSTNVNAKHQVSGANRGLTSLAYSPF